MMDQSNELRELRMQLALGLITVQDLTWALRYPNRRAPGERVWWAPAHAQVFEARARKYVIDPRCPDDVLHFISKVVNRGSKGI